MMKDIEMTQHISRRYKHKDKRKDEMSGRDISET